MADPVTQQKDPYQVALDQLHRFGLEVEQLEVTGRYKSVRHSGDKPRKKKGWYIASELRLANGNLVVIGAYGWWLEPDVKHKLRFDLPTLTPAEQADLQARQNAVARAHEQARADAASEAARRAADIWGKLPDQGASPYLDRKGVRAFGLRFSRGSICVPFRNAKGALVGLQFIDPEGAKRNLTGAAKKGAAHRLGAVGDQAEIIALCEGYATGATIHQAVGWPVYVCFDTGNLLPVARAVRQAHPSNPIVICGDDDRATQGNPGLKGAQRAAKAVAALVLMPPLEDAPGTDWNDLQAAIGLERVAERLLGAAVQAGPPAERASTVVPGEFPGIDWQQRLMRTERKAIKANAFNTRLILSNDPDWTDVLGWCEMSHSIQKRAPPPLEHAARGEWEDADDAELRFWLAGRYGIEPKGQDLADAVLGAARAQRFHPVREYLDGLVWDGRERLACWLADYLGCETVTPSTTPDEAPIDQARYLETVGRMWLIQAISRVRHPGLKADSVLILEGTQGRGKSTALGVLFGDWFSDTPIDIGSKDAYEAIRGLWCLELAELESLNKADATRAKAFFSSPMDRFRMPYGRRAQRFTRQCVIAGTTNQFQHLKDHTGNRRYWSVTVGEIQLDLLRAHRDQLWAEADHLFRQGEHWWPAAEDAALFEEQQDARLDADVWETLIADWLRSRIEDTPPDQRLSAFVTAADIMSEALKIDRGSMKRPEQTRVGMIMTKLHWRYCKPRMRGQRVPGYRPSIGYLQQLESGVDNAAQF